MWWLAGVIVLGAREGRFGKRGEKSNAISKYSTWEHFYFGLVGLDLMDSQLAMGTFDDVNAISKIAVNTHLAGAAGTFAGAVVTRLIGGKTDVIMMLNGALAGLVAITAEPLTPVQLQPCLLVQSVQLLCTLELKCLKITD